MVRIFAVEGAPVDIEIYRDRDREQVSKLLADQSLRRCLVSACGDVDLGEDFERAVVRSDDPTTCCALSALSSVLHPAVAAHGEA
jgi:hypothetical protein